MNDEDKLSHTSAHQAYLMFPTRYVFTVFGFLGFFCAFALRVNLNVAIIAMVREPLVQDVLQFENNTVTCPELLSNNQKGNNSIRIKPKLIGEFDWDSNVQGLVLGSFYYGCVFTRIPGGILAERYSAKWLCGIGILLTSIMSLLTPILSRWNVWALIVSRVLQGLFSGVIPASMHCLIGRWAPKYERSRITIIIYSGCSMGIMVSLSVSSILSNSKFLGGWPAVFYVFGLIGCVWFVFWITLVFDSPDKHPYISKEELLYIRLEQDEIHSHKAPKPWKLIFTSSPFWGLVVTHFCYDWGFYTLLIELPTYLSNVLHFDLGTNGILSALPNLIKVFIALLASIAADYLMASGQLQPTTTRKIMNSIGLYIPAMCVLPIAFIGCQPMIILVLITLAISINGFASSGFLVTHVDMCPELAGTLMGISNCVSSFSGFLAPSFVGWIIQDGQTVERWGNVFIATSTIFFIGGTVYNFFCTSERQSWGTNHYASKSSSITDRIPQISSIVLEQSDTKL